MSQWAYKAVTVGWEVFKMYRCVEGCCSSTLQEDPSQKLQFYSPKHTKRKKQQKLYIKWRWNKCDFLKMFISMLINLERGITKNFKNAFKGIPLDTTVCKKQFYIFIIFSLQRVSTSYVFKNIFDHKDYFLHYLRKSKTTLIVRFYAFNFI